MINIRQANPADAIAITRVQVTTWRAAYAGIVPQDFLDNMLNGDWQRDRAARWSQGLENPAYVAFVAEHESAGVVGFVFGGACRDGLPALADYHGEIYAIYILPEHQGAGTGRRLVTVFGRRMVQAGYEKMLLWVLKDNQPARKFYERLGGHYLMEKEFNLGGKDLLEVAYGWTDLSIFHEEAL